MCVTGTYLFNAADPYFVGSDENIGHEAIGLNPFRTVDSTKQVKTRHCLR